MRTERTYSRIGYNINTYLMCEKQTIVQRLLTDEPEQSALPNRTAEVDLDARDLYARYMDYSLP